MPLPPLVSTIVYMKPHDSPVSLPTILAGTSGYAPHAFEEITTMLGSEQLRAGVALPIVSAHGDVGVRTDLQVLLLTDTALLLWYGYAGDTNDSGYSSHLAVTTKPAVHAVDLTFDRNSAGLVEEVTLVVRTGGDTNYFTSFDNEIDFDSDNHDNAVDDETAIAVGVGTRIVSEGITVVAERATDGDALVAGVTQFGSAVMTWVRT